MIFNPMIEGGIDTSDATAAASDIASGKTAYVDSEKVTGSVTVIDSGQSAGTLASRTGSGSSGGKDVIWGYTDFSTPRLYRSGATHMIGIAIEDLGNATAADVARGKTFTSASGIKVYGSLSDTIYNENTTPNTSGPYGTSYISMSIAPPDVDRIIHVDTPWTVSSHLSNFGNATAADVAAGKTFTSTAGLKVMGTATLGGIEQASISVVNQTSSDIEIQYYSDSDYNNLSLAAGRPTTISVNKGSLLVVYGYGEISDDGSTLPYLDWMLDGADTMMVYRVPSDTTSGTVFLTDW